MFRSIYHKITLPDPQLHEPSVWNVYNECPKYCDPRSTLIPELFLPAMIAPLWIVWHEMNISNVMTKEIASFEPLLIQALWALCRFSQQIEAHPWLFPTGHYGRPAGFDRNTLIQLFPLHAAKQTGKSNRVCVFSWDVLSFCDARRALSRFYLSIGSQTPSSSPCTLKTKARR